MTVIFQFHDCENQQGTCSCPGSTWGCHTSSLCTLVTDGGQKLSQHPGAPEAEQESGGQWPCGWCPGTLSALLHLWGHKRNEQIAAQIKTQMSYLSTFNLTLIFTKELDTDDKKGEKDFVFQKCFLFTCGITHSSDFNWNVSYVTIHGISVYLLSNTCEWADTLTVFYELCGCYGALKIKCCTETLLIQTELVLLLQHHIRSI